MTETRPALQEGLSAADFGRFYWRKDELAPFCRERGISQRGSKADIVSRVEEYLKTGAVEKPKAGKRTSCPDPVKRRAELEPLSLDSPLTEKFKAGQTSRAVFEAAIGPQFHFTVRLMKFCRENPGKTYRDAVAEWHAEREDKKSGRQDLQISLACEYNRFTRDYLTANRDRTLKDAAAAWNQYKILPKERRP